MGSRIVVPDSIPRKIVTRSHPRYESRYTTLRFYRENFEGSGGYGPFLDTITVSDTWPDDLQDGSIQPDDNRRTYLIRHPREKKKFWRRVMMAYLTNVIKRSVQMMTGYLTKKQPAYEDYPNPVMDWMSEVTPAGDTWESYKIQEIIPRVIYYGELPVIFYRKPTESLTQAQQIETGGQLQVGIINPEAIIDWQRDDRGGYLWLKVKEETDSNDPLDERHSTQVRYWYYTQDGYFVAEDTKDDLLPIVASGSWADGMPIVVWRLGTDGQSLIADACTTQRELFNVNSLIQEQEYSTTFAMLAAPDMGGEANKERTKKVSSDNVWWFSNEARHPPFWMAPPPTVLDHFIEKANILQEQVLSEMGLDFDKGGGQTGMAFSFKMSKIVRLLQGIATSMQRGESQSLVRVGKELNSEVGEKARCVWPSEFDAKDVEKELDGLERVLDRVDSPTFKEEAQFRMAITGMPDMDEAMRAKARKEIKKAIKEAEENDSFGADEQPDEAVERIQAATPEEFNKPKPNEAEGNGVPNAEAR